MINELPPELFAQRPERSYQHLHAKGVASVTKRRIVFLVSLALVVTASVFIVDYMISQPKEEVALIPRIETGGVIKERPEQPGGIDIPHRDVAVFNQIDEQVDEAKEAKVEQLLPQSEEPQIDLDAINEDATSVMRETVEESLTVELNNASEKLPPAVTEAVVPKEEAVITEKPVIEVNKPVVEVSTQALPQQTIETKVKNAVKKAEETMKIDPPVAKNIVEPVKAIEPKVTAKAVNVPAQPKETQRLPSELFTGDVTKVSTGEVLRRLQLGSFRSHDIARKASEVMAKKHSSALQGVKLTVQRADLGSKGIYYRVKSGTLPITSAKSICEAIKATKSACLVVK